MLDGVVPGTAVVARGSVAELGWVETITDKGTAVGFVDNRVTLGSVVVFEGAAVTAAEPDDDTEDDPGALDVTGLGEVTEVAWRAPRACLALGWST